MTSGSNFVRIVASVKTPERTYVESFVIDHWAEAYLVHVKTPHPLTEEELSVLRATIDGDYTERGLKTPIFLVSDDDLEIKVYGLKHGPQELEAGDGS